MSKIHVMDEGLANKIAAGEVVERPMNVVKELTENAVDAKSTEISIFLRDAGVKEVKVVDNGIGMDREDATLAFSRHATSKLRDLNDLFHIMSLGFRGEALPSIAAVSEVTLKTSNGEEGTEVVIDGGVMQKVSSSDIRVGTSISVRNLFYNTPVRLKYLKNLYAELAVITEYINKMALSYPNIKFTFVNNDKTLLKTDGSGRLLKVINDIYGIQVTKNMIYVEGDSDDYKIHGYISRPEVVKGTRNSITTLVNGRVIKDNELNRTILDAYHTYIAVDKSPIVVMSIEVDPNLVDINVHPTKMDIKFSKIEDLKYLITKLIDDQLQTKNLIQVGIDKVDMSKVETHVTNHYANVNIKDEFDSEKKDEEFAEFENMQLDLQVEEKQEEYHPAEPRIKPMTPIGAIHCTYIIAENEDGMYVIDQHAAAERVNYEKFMRELSKKEKAKMDLLVPIKIELPTNDYLILKQHLDVLDTIGITYEEFGFNTLLIRSTPVWFKKGEEEASIHTVIDMIIETKTFEISKFIEKVATSLACKTSIKANDYISLEDMKVLLEQLRHADNPFTCPHGRPSIIKYTNYDLERLFKRAE